METRFYEFGSFRLDVHRRQLERDGQQVHVSPRAFDLLRVLVQNAGQTLSHDELLDKVWEGTFVEQGNLKKAVSTLRQILGDAAESGEFITTVPRRGYRFTAPVNVPDDAAFTVRETRTELVVEEKVETRKSFAAKLMPMILVAAVLFGAAFVGWQFFRRPASTFSVQEVQYSRILSSGNISGGDLSADGRLFSYLEGGDGKVSLVIRNTETGSSIRVLEPVTGSIWDTKISPDNNYIYYFRYDTANTASSGLYRISTFGGTPQLITQTRSAGLKISPDSKRIAVMQAYVENGKERQVINTLDVDGGNERQIYIVPEGEWIRGISWSTDGAKLLAIARRGESGTNPISFAFDIPSVGGDRTIVMPEKPGLYSNGALMPDGQSIILQKREQNAESSQLWQYFPATDVMSRVTNDEHSYAPPAINSAGTAIGVTRSYAITSIWVGPRDSSEQRQVSGMSDLYSISWASNVRLVVSTMIDKNEAVAALDIDGTNKAVLLDGPNGIRPFPSVSDDLGYITYLTNRTGVRTVWRANMDGSNAQTIPNTENAGDAKLLSDGQTLVFSKWFPETRDWRLVRRAPDGAIHVIPNSTMLVWDVSPDGRKVLILTPTDPSSPDIVALRDIESGTTLRTFPIARTDCIRFAPDGRSFAYLKPLGLGDQIIEQPLDGSEAKVLVTTTGERIRRFAYSPDGANIATVRKTEQTDAVLIRIPNSK
ncbi:MAG: winged helix-turn-helix domain-containing protein [Blastocatellia bacterium]|nr:winged helix-turn-helix domain-containing protein [Blastocatellia bacterium]